MHAWHWVYRARVSICLLCPLRACVGCSWTDASQCETAVLVTRSVAATGANNVTVSQQGISLVCGSRCVLALALEAAVL